MTFIMNLLKVTYEFDHLARGCDECKQKRHEKLYKWIILRARVPATLVREENYSAHTVRKKLVTLGAEGVSYALEGLTKNEAYFYVFGPAESEFSTRTSLRWLIFGPISVRMWDFTGYPPRAAASDRSGGLMNKWSPCRFLVLYAKRIHSFMSPPLRSLAAARGGYRQTPVFAGVWFQKSTENTESTNTFEKNRKFQVLQRSDLCIQVLLQRVTNLAIRLNNAAPCGTRIFDRAGNKNFPHAVIKIVNVISMARICNIHFCLLIDLKNDKNVRLTVFINRYFFYVNKRTMRVWAVTAL
ncbi:unnamed protein product [Trichogramma brassicae]|uniref:Uncharacterized protein n=1 Tax=Trichogramma brassicae TaxID=86971 RepID=A0A6H5INW5_9HYME|nr:unnamed protein product [Trichogramma brassicae]